MVNSPVFPEKAISCPDCTKSPFSTSISESTLDYHQFQVEFEETAEPKKERSWLKYILFAFTGITLLITLFIVMNLNFQTNQNISQKGHLSGNSHQSRHVALANYVFFWSMSKQKSNSYLHTVPRTDKFAIVQCVLCEPTRAARSAGIRELDSSIAKDLIDSEDPKHRLFSILW